jgi:hypothetical protein
MAKIGLAAELAKQAAQAAREELAVAEGKTVAKAPATPAWSVPQLAPDFMLDDAMQRAAVKVTGHYRNVLAPQGLHVDLEPHTGGELVGAVADEKQGVAPFQASLREQQSGRLVKAYTTPALLTLFATQQQATGVVVDGQV